jgi:hypothetical protein
MNTITTAQREILTSIEGTNIWSGQGPQTYNSQAIAWGGLAKQLFSAGGTYQWVTYAFLIGFTLPVPFWIAHKYFPKMRWDYWNTAIIANFIGLLYVGINSVTMPWFYVGVISQWYLRKYRPNWFIKYNYILSAAMDGGTQVIVFILAFAVQGGAGNPVRLLPLSSLIYSTVKILTRSRSHSHHIGAITTIVETSTTACRIRTRRLVLVDEATSGCDDQVHTLAVYLIESLTCVPHIST